MQRNYDPSNHCRHSFTLTSGRAITLKSLSQRMTYAGWLAGTPTQQHNDRMISELIEEVKQDFWCAGSVHVLPPLRRDFFREPGDMSYFPHHGMAPQWIPGITCIGHFESFPPARDQTMNASSLTMIWFQDDFAMPIAPSSLEAIRSVDWISLATDFDF